VDSAVVIDVDPSVHISVAAIGVFHQHAGGVHDLPAPQRSRPAGDSQRIGRLGDAKPRARVVHAGADAAAVPKPAVVGGLDHAGDAVVSGAAPGAKRTGAGVVNDQIVVIRLQSRAAGEAQGSRADHATSIGVD